MNHFVVVAGELFVLVVCWLVCWLVLAG